MPSQYIGSGRLYIKKQGASSFTEVGLIQDISLNVSTDKAELMDYKSGVGVVTAMAITKQTYTLKFTTADISPEILAMAFFSDVTTLTGGTLPQQGQEGYIDGATAIALIKANSKSLMWTGEIKIEEVPVQGAKGIFYFPNVQLSMDGDMSLMGNEYRKITFTANCGLDDNGHAFKLYKQTA